MTTTIDGAWALEPRYQASDEIRNHGVDCTGKLETGELMTGTPTITAEVLADNRTDAEIASLPTPAALALSNKQVSTAILTINSKRVPVGQAVAFTCTGGTSGVDYKIKILCGTNSTPAETVKGKLELKVRD